MDDPDRATAAALLSEVMSGDHSNDSADAVVAQALKARALVERQRTLADARAVIERETSDYPDASPAVTSGIWGGFDQWAVSEYTHLADPDRRLCGTCGQRHTQYEYDDAHRNDEGGY
jgi:hypothetical protein